VTDENRLTSVGSSRQSHTTRVRFLGTRLYQWVYVSQSDAAVVTHYLLCI